MQRPIRELEALRPEQIDMNDPDIPETLKIRAWNAMARERERMAYERGAQEGGKCDAKTDQAR